MTHEEAEKMLEDVAEKLGEHFDAVQILASYNEDCETTLVKRGSGNWYARQGMAHEFINSDINQDAAEQLARRLDQDEE